MVCPVLCPPLILGGSILSKYLGLSDLIIGLWFGSLLMTLYIVTIKILDKRRIRFPFRKVILFFAFFFLTYYPMYALNMITYIPKIWIFDLFIFGNILGILAIISAELLDKYLRKINKGKVFVPFQSVIVPMTIIILLTLILYFGVKI
ncbi:MAG: hypothetical protein QW197_02935 [Candidatus Aenigmatarchaeota archaeon]